MYVNNKNLNSKSLFVVVVILRLAIYIGFGRWFFLYTQINWFQRNKRYHAYPSFVSASKHKSIDHHLAISEYSILIWKNSHFSFVAQPCNILFNQKPSSFHLIPSIVASLWPHKTYFFSVAICSRDLFENVHWKAAAKREMCVIKWSMNMFEQW